MPHVGVKRLGSGYREHHRAHGDERAHRFLDVEVDRIARVQGRQHDRRVIDDVSHPEHRKDDEIE